MKNTKFVQATLLVIVLALWGTIACNVLNYQDGLNTPATYRISSENRPITSTEEAIEFDLLLDYRDPFLGKQRPKKTRARPTSQTPKTTPRQTRENSVTTPVKRTKISYRGYLLTDRQVTSVRLDVNGKAGTYRSGDSGKGFSISRMSRDSIEVLFLDGETKYIYRKR